MYKGLKVQDFRALKTLIQLLDENDTSDGAEHTALSSLDEEDPDTEMQPEPLKFKVKSQKFAELQTCPAVWAFLKQAIKQIESFSFPHHIVGNLTQAQQMSLTSIIQNDQIVVKPVDKGRTIVIMHRDQYIQMCEIVFFA